MTDDTHSVETVLALLVPLATWAEVSGVAWYPTWLSVGPMTLGMSAVPPVLLAVAVCVGVARRWRAGHRPHVGRLALAGLGGVTLLTAVWATATLNLSAPGLYVAGLFPMFVGNLLAVGVVGSWVARWLE